MRSRVLLVEDGESRIALSTARALARSGWVVGVGSPHRSHATVSRATTFRHRVPRVTEDPAGFATAVRAAVEHTGYDVVFGTGDAEVLALSAARDTLTATVPYAPHAVVVSSIDKSGLRAAAHASGLRTPRTLDLHALHGVEGSLIVKPSLNGHVGHVGVSKTEAKRVTGGAEAARQAAVVAAAGAVPLVQEAVCGDLLALVLLVDGRGRTVAAVQQRAERLYPAYAGISARARTEPVSADLERRATDMLTRLGWQGLVELQFIAEPGADPVLIDLNGRFYGSLALALAAGVNLPDLWARQALGLPNGPRIEARAGVGYQWLEGDLRRAVQERRGGLLRDLGDCLAAAPHLNHSMWAADDPLPLVRQTSRLARLGVVKLARGVAASARA